VFETVVGGEGDEDGNNDGDVVVGREVKRVVEDDFVPTMQRNKRLERKS
jgi:hypothetical protein